MYVYIYICKYIFIYVYMLTIVDPKTAKTNWQENAKLELQVDST